MCHDNDYQNMEYFTRNSNPAHGVCCKPDATSSHCVHDPVLHVCSEPVEADEGSEYLGIIT